MTENFELPGYLVPVWAVNNGKLNFLGANCVRTMEQARNLLLRHFHGYQSRYLFEIPKWEEAGIPIVMDNQIIVLGTFMRPGALMLQVWEINSKGTTREDNEKETQSLKLIYEEVIAQGKPIPDYKYNTLQSLYTLTAPHINVLSLFYKFGVY